MTTIYRLACRLAIVGLLMTIASRHRVVAAPPPTNKQLTNSLGMKFTTIPAGEFLMGATPEEIAERREQLIKRSGDDHNALEIKKQELAWVESEGPQHRVTISKNYLLGTYEVTQSEFQSVMGFNPSDHAATGGRARIMAGIDTGRHPVEKVSWNDAVEFCRQLSSLAEEVAAGRSYRLPTEAEWEYAYRAGTATKFYWGDDVNPSIRERLNYKKLTTYKKATTVPVGSISIEPNPWGLYDMAGNVREWCADWYDVKSYTKEPVRDPSGLATGEDRVTRGPMSYYFPPNIRSAARRAYAPDVVNNFIGFRVVCIPGEVPKIVQTAAAPPPDRSTTPAERTRPAGNALRLGRRGQLCPLHDGAGTNAGRLLQRAPRGRRRQEATPTCFRHTSRCARGPRRRPQHDPLFRHVA